MGRFGFIGPTYASRSLSADCQRAVNFYPEIVESGQGKTRVALYGTPGLSEFCGLPESPIRGFTEYRDKLLAVAGKRLYSVAPDGTYTDLGAVSPSTDTTPVSMASSGTQVVIVSGTAGYLWDAATATLTAGVGGPAPIMVAYVDGYFVAIQEDSRNFRISGLLDGGSWNAIDTALIKSVPDNVVTIVSDHLESWIFGSQHSGAYYNSGNSDFPFETIPGAFIETGIAAKDSAAKMDNSMCWLGKDPRGAGVVLRAEGYRPVRISNHAVEAAIQSYPSISDAIGYTYQDGGHSFYVLYFPSARANPAAAGPHPSPTAYLGATWVYDAATQMWHERAWWDIEYGLYREHRSRCHQYIFDKHLVGDWKSGKVYEMSHSFYDDDGDAIRRMRTAPHISVEAKRLFYSRFQLDMEVGVGLATGQGSDPQVMLQWSDDGGKTWSNEYWASAGKIGEYRKRVIWQRLGSARDRVFRVVTSDPVPITLMDAYLDVTAGGN